MDVRGFLMARSATNSTGDPTGQALVLPRRPSITTVYATITDVSLGTEPPCWHAFSFRERYEILVAIFTLLNTLCGRTCNSSLILAESAAM